MSEQEQQHFTRDSLPEGDWRNYMKKVATKMLRVDGPFSVETREGTLSCEDGFLAVDSGGYPYPIAADEHARIYVQLSEAEKPT